MSVRTFLDGRVVLHAGDCLDVVRSLPDASIDSVVTDPPYALVSISKRFANSPRSEATEMSAAGPYQRTGRGFMGQTWDNGQRAFSVEFWTEVLRVLKPGGHVLAFAGTRTYHRLTCAIEDACFEIRDQIGWAYGSGFPKSHNAGGGWGTALKPAWEPICVARKPLIGTVAQNVLLHGTGALNVDGCRTVSGENLNGGAYAKAGGRGPMAGDEREGAALGMFQAGKTAGREFVSPVGRWPANLIHDGSDEVVAAFPNAPGQQGALTGREPSPTFGGDIYGKMARSEASTPRGDAGSAARFFYSAKADQNDRLGSRHPTVKPVDLMQWLVRLVTPPGGTVLDPFSGTGTTGEAAFREGFSAILIEREAEYQADIARRMALVLAGPDERRNATTKARGKVEHAGPLFAEPAA